ncbi:hypothetical protein [Caldilinea sp.]|jgi:hypothetical protein|uniref:hypothetical protein n=1 Tax=Caldilinea sp. TaxID=2293560 RepID=UPI0021DF3608|nr:hypothetical protein [Caldilinea sp.]GIV71061.1 MAG: hypothetical protein KatS3mg048_3923 [Caldilinea sp.]
MAEAVLCSENTVQNVRRRFLEGGAPQYATLARKEAHRLVKCSEWRYTPEHAGWLNIAECEPSVLATQCLKWRIPDKETPACEAHSGTPSQSSTGQNTPAVYDR